MKHCVLFKLAPGADAEKVRHNIWKTWQKLDDTLDWLNRPVIYPGCADAASDFDLMATFEMDDPKQLAEYDAHPLKIALDEALKDALAEQKTFNHY